MKFDLTWHGPVCDRSYAVEADTEEDALAELARALCENDEEWLRSHKAEDEMANKRCEGWCEPCGAAATKSVEVKDGVRWITIGLCDAHYEAFVRDTDTEVRNGEIEKRF